ncbi:hypothetical protein CJP72_20625 [Citrobacter sp. NCU1]|nr:hypothetical protein [Citrobacter sp. NCU1]
MISFSTGDVIIIMMYIALAFIVPIAFIIPFLLRRKREENDNAGFISLIYLELPIGVTALLHTIYFHHYFDNVFDCVFNLIPYTLILWFVYFSRQKTPWSSTKILRTGWCLFALTFILHTLCLLPTKNTADYDTAVNIALRKGDGAALDSLWKTCPEGIDSLLFDMKFNYNGNNDFDYPIASFEKVLQCSDYKNDYTSNYAINDSFRDSTSINFLTLLYSRIDANKKKEIQSDKTIINNRLSNLRQCMRDDECSKIKIKMLNFLLKLEPKWQDDLTITLKDLHNAIMNSNKISISYFEKFVKPENENDVIAMAVVFGDNQSVISKIKDKKRLQSVIGKEYGDFGDDITLVEFIIRNGTEPMIDFIINDLNVDVICYSSASTINYNSIVSSEYNYKYNKRFENSTCTHPIKS